VIQEIIDLHCNSQMHVHLIHYDMRKFTFSNTQYGTVYRIM